MDVLKTLLRHGVQNIDIRLSWMACHRMGRLESFREVGDELSSHHKPNVLVNMVL
jgi:hypothetical protein